MDTREATEDGSDEDDPQIPVTWPWELIITLYKFGDKHDTKAFRNMMMDVALQKALQCMPRVYLWPNHAVQRMIFGHLPASSPLHRLFLDINVYEINFDDDESRVKAIEMLPSEVLTSLFLRTMKLAKKLDCEKCKCEKPCQHWHASMPLRPDFRYDFCRYHEHESEQEKEACADKCKALRAKHCIIIEEDLSPVA